MKQMGKVIEVLQDNMIKIECDRQSACSACDNAASCTEKCKKVYATAQNTVGAVIGDLVEIEADTAVFIKNAIAVFIFPIIIAVLSYFVFDMIFGEGITVLFTLSFLVMSAVITASVLNKRAEKNVLNKTVRKIR